MSCASEPLESDAAARDAAVAVKSAVTLGASLIATWTVALLVRLYLPRHLGPERFGIFNFADSFAATFFIVLGLGVETYIRKEIPVRPRHASDFFGGFIAVRLLMGAAVFAAMAAVMALTHRPPEAQRIVFIFGAAQLLVTLNGSLAALLHASRMVGGLALVNVATKVLWGVGVAFAVAIDRGLAGLSLAFLAAEAVRAAALSWLARRHLGVRLRFDPAAVKVVIVASLPFYLNQVANTVYAKVDVSMLSVLANDAEVGWYGSAQNLASLALLASPLVGWVLLPLLSRAAARSREELFAMVRRAIAVVLLLVLPISLLTGVGADVWIPGLFGRSFAPATLSLRILAPIFVLTYLAMISAMCLFLLERAWTVTAISLVALVVNPTLNLALVPAAMRSLGPGGAGAGAALSLLLTELGVTVALTVAMGRDAFDRASTATIGKTAISGLVVIAVDRALLRFGAARLPLDAATYLILLFALGAVRLAEIQRLARFVLQQRGEHARA
jgi:O-antigen/teichoic acid export membrane protein